MRYFEVKVCKRCGKKYTPTNGRQKYCIECGSIVEQELKNLWRRNHRDRIRESANQYIKQWVRTHLEKRRESHRRGCYIRKRNFDYIPLNLKHEGDVFHHLDRVYGIYMPEEIHRGIYHSVIRNVNMDIINAIAWNYI